MSKHMEPHGIVNIRQINGYILINISIVHDAHP